ncbi:STM4013/SEN3800 family hydrolase [Luteolibacter yonseiensis]|uniref:STM4013/SEN3800 family hydrolase n=2 Tax=Luteolibacter yonseiensis TaxID=1144680 RepID=A0A934R2E9_9BACT|nr:STM4013/SEN3800 family hydrolase [Luteolibacter yonseiensis]
MPPDMNQLLGTHDLVWVVPDALRFDVAEREMRNGGTPNLAALFPSGWEKRHSPGSFTFPAHQAFFAGFLPTPADPAADRQRLFAARFAGSETAGAGTVLFDEPDIVHGLEARGYHTLCIGGVGFFNRQTELSRVLPGYFAESHWSEETGVTHPDSARIQFELAARRLGEIRVDQKVFLFVNLSAIHQPNRHYIPGAREDNLATHAAALREVDSRFPILLEALKSRGPVHLLVFSDHGTLYGEDGFTGHRFGHPDIYTVPYAAALLP